MNMTARIVEYVEATRRSSYRLGIGRYLYHGSSVDSRLRTTPCGHRDQDARHATGVSAESYNYKGRAER